MSVDDEISKDLAEILVLVEKIQDERQRPLLLLFYPHRASIAEFNIEQLHLALGREGKLKRTEPLPALDVLLHTVGGDPITSYRLAQLVRSYADEVDYLVPEYAYSGGTLMCLSADHIYVGDYAVLSPIDITLVHERDSDKDEKESELFSEERDEAPDVELVAIDHFIQVAKNARIELEREFRRRGWKNSKTEVEAALLCKMTDELGVLNIAKYYREKNITLEYAKQLLNQRMFRNLPPPLRAERIGRILRSLVVEAPSHEYPMDYNLCKEIGLRIEQMSEALAEVTRTLTRHLQKMVHAGKIGKHDPGREMAPFFVYFSYGPGTDDTLEFEEETEDGDDEENTNTTEAAATAALGETGGIKIAPGTADGAHSGDV